MSREPDSQQGLGFSAEFIVAPGHGAQFFQHHASEFSARICQVVRDVSRLDSKSPRHFFVGELLATLIDVIQFEQLKMQRLVLRLAFVAKAIDRQAEQAARKLFREELLGTAGAPDRAVRAIRLPPSRSPAARWRRSPPRFWRWAALSVFMTKPSTHTRR